MKNANGLDYFINGEPLPGLSGKVDTSGLDYFALGEPYLVIASGVVSGGTTYTETGYGVLAAEASGTSSHVAPAAEYIEMGGAITSLTAYGAGILGRGISQGLMIGNGRVRLLNPLYEIDMVIG
jgi:hypothetical protein